MVPNETGLNNRRRICGVLLALMGLAALSFGQTPTVPQNEPPAAPQTTEFTSLHKSLLLPGWGQFSEKHYVEGVIFSSAAVFGLVQVFSFNHKGNRYYRKYQEAANVEEVTRFRDLTEKYDTRRNQYLLITAGIWAVNLIDIYVIVKRKEKKKKDLQLKLEHGGDKALAVSLCYRF